MVQGSVIGIFNFLELFWNYTDLVLIFHTGTESFCKFWININILSWLTKYTKWVFSSWSKLSIGPWTIALHLIASLTVTMFWRVVSMALLANVVSNRFILLYGIAIPSRFISAISFFHQETSWTVSKTRIFCVIIVWKTKNIVWHFKSCPSKLSNFGKISLNTLCHESGNFWKNIL